ncbi:hypothetical protein M378DRAFT_157429 [Amanita muscaria Koide BX008]|uniref:Uncharacterized protein n=1 Tax=Amanita muscaria (strain Koide BX008) TaxID=946122 RepID=A0A0C2TPP8_AMAMK|nr:hypothetical protein M378DRAFT_157429 [Amanita muscaria Koide BX008]
MENEEEAGSESLEKEGENNEVNTSGFRPNSHSYISLWLPASPSQFSVIP